VRKTKLLGLGLAASATTIAQANPPEAFTGLMVAYACAAQFPAETKRRVLMDAFLPGVTGWDAVYNNPAIWHFRFNGEYPQKISARRERT
jgi:hypothetical protein